MPASRSGESDVPGTLQRSPAKAQRTYKEVHDRAVETHGEGEQAHRVAFAALKHSRNLGVKGASRMTKEQLGEAIAKKQ